MWNRVQAAATAKGLVDATNEGLFAEALSPLRTD
jgi:hypothetical protein